MDTTDQTCCLYTWSALCCLTADNLMIVLLTFCVEIIAMAWPCKRLRLSAGDKDRNDNNDDKVVVTAVTSDVNTPFNKVELKTETITIPVQRPATDNVAAAQCLTTEPKPSTIDLTIDSPPSDTRRNVLHTAAVIKARYSPHQPHVGQVFWTPELFT